MSTTIIIILQFISVFTFFGALYSPTLSHINTSNVDNPRIKKNSVTRVMTSNSITQFNLSKIRAHCRLLPPGEYHIGINTSVRKTVQFILHLWSSDLDFGPIWPKS